MNKSAPQFLRNFLILAVSLFTGLILSLIIGMHYDQLIIISPFITILDSLFLGIGILISLYFIRYLAPHTNNVVFMLGLAFGLILGVGIIAFGVFFLYKPSAFLYSDNRTVTYLLVNLLFFLSINTIISGSVIFQETILKKEKALHEESVLKTQMELKLLASKINPHFLFNSLNMLVSLLKTPEKAEEALINLSEILRYQLDFSDAQQVSLGSELAIIEKYLSLQQMRFGKKLSYRINCGIEAEIPPMIIQPLVENCIKHNIDEPENLEIKISVTRDNDRIILNMIDSMARLTPDMLEQGVGLTVTAKRVEIMGGTF